MYAIRSYYGTSAFRLPLLAALGTGRSGGGGTPRTFPYRLSAVFNRACSPGRARSNRSRQPGGQMQNGESKNLAARNVRPCRRLFQPPGPVRVAGSGVRKHRSRSAWTKARKGNQAAARPDFHHPDRGSGLGGPVRDRGRGPGSRGCSPERAVALFYSPILINQPRTRPA